MSYGRQLSYDNDGQPLLIIHVHGHHDVGRMLNTLAGGLVEQAHFARRVASAMWRTDKGKRVLNYLLSHGARRWW